MGSQCNRQQPVSANQGSNHRQPGPIATGTYAQDHEVLADVGEGPYCIIASFLDAATLCQTDATCRMLNGCNQAQTGPWFALGTQTFEGLELEQDGLFEQPALSNHEGDELFSRMD